MQYPLSNINKTLWIICLGTLLASIVFFCFTWSYWVLCTPFVVAYILLTGANWKLAYLLLIFFIPVSVQIGLLNDAVALSLPDEPMCWLFLLVFMLLVASKPSIIPAWWLQNPITWIVILQLLWLLVAVTFSTVLFYSLKFLIAKTWYLVCFFAFPVLVFRDKKDLRILFHLFFWTILVTMGIIVFRHALLQFRFADIQTAVRWLYLNHVEYGAVVSIFLPFVVIAFVLTDKKKRGTRVLLLLSILFFLVVTYLSYARASMLAIIFSAVIAVSIRLRLVNIVMPAIYGVIVLVFIWFVRDGTYLKLAPNYEHTYMHSDYMSHIKATMQGRDMSSMERIYRWIAAVRMSADRPLTGYGPHGFVYNYKPYGLYMFQTYVSKNEEGSTTHNYFLLMLTEQGWPAMLLYALLVMVVFALAQRTYYRFTDRFYKYCTLGLAMAFAACFVNNFFSEFVETHRVGAMFYLILSLLIILENKSRSEELTPAV